MDELGDAGSVTFLEHIMNPLSIARLVMEGTAHVMLSGEGPFSLHWRMDLIRKSSIRTIPERAGKRAYQGQ